MTDFTTQYHHLDKDQLLRLWADRSNLVIEAQAALQNEMVKRGLTQESVQVQRADSGEIAPARPGVHKARGLKFIGLVLLNVVVAVIGTAILETALSKVIPVHSLAALVWKACILSVVCAAFIGWGMWRTWRNDAAKWAWVLPAAWFAFGLLAMAGHGIWGPLSVSPAHGGAAEMRSFFLFTIPLIRAAAYSVGAYISSLVYPVARGQVAVSS